MRPFLGHCKMRPNRRWPEVPEGPEELEVRAAQQDSHEEPNVRAAQHEAPEEPNVKDEAGDQPPVTYRLDQF
jgi:hypothetical protein